MSSSFFWDDLKDKDFAHAYADEFLNILIATQLKVLRGKRRQEDIAQLAGMAQERISVLENVNYSSWSVNTLRKLAKAHDLRLRISFESFSTLVEDIRRLNEEGLKRKSREDELREFLESEPRELIAYMSGTQSSDSAPRESSVLSAAKPPQDNFMRINQGRLSSPALNNAYAQALRAGQQEGVRP